MPVQVAPFLLYFGQLTWTKVLIFHKVMGNMPKGIFWLLHFKNRKALKILEIEWKLYGL